MCGAPCAALTGGCARAGIGFQLGRAIGYAAGGALAAQSMAALGTWSEAAPALRPLWTLLHLGLLALGLWWLTRGRQPDWMKRSSSVPVRFVDSRRRTARASLAGLVWVAWPCGALQAALLLSALADSAAGGALVMAAFAAASMPALALTPWLWTRWQAMTGRAASPVRATALSFRLAGGGLVLASGWALTHGIWSRLAAWCGV